MKTITLYTGSNPRFYRNPENVEVSNSTSAVRFEFGGKRVEFFGPFFIETDLADFTAIAVKNPE